ncbi:hypothetical protein H5407_19810 [Mitsuaria sp. WAJ17]|uniref:hypothetical protein n=1 Tax=Mitsuaria sp. WAJ17 TaxID=2761452 RepID=UPI0016027027|nr:hypothetical protein [Mitsuaria sp. WAJ17]MBB2487486.1 hypothetical protein [Mitsuaria sp. WAJ17]
MLDACIPVLAPLSAPWSPAGFVEQDLSDLADQMQHCRRRHVRLLHVAERLLQLLIRHAVTLLVLVLLLFAASVAAS